MTPEEKKAKELVDQFVKYAKRPKSLVNKEYYISDLSENAKQCALICVDEILNVRKLYISSNGNNNPDRNGRGYWLLCKSLQMSSYRA